MKEITPCTIKISSLYPASQVLAEIAWIDREIERVTELMKRRPSKIRHLSDLERQKRDRQQILEANDQAHVARDEK
jgi:hypothetical protein